MVQKKPPTSPHKKRSLSSRTHRELTIKGDPTNLIIVRNFIAQSARLGKLSENAIDDIVIAVDEACSNILEHNYTKRLRLEKSISITVTIDRKHFRVDITDEGKHFDPTKHRVPPTSRHLKEMKSRGMGIYLMTRLTDSLTHRYSEKTGNTLTMIKKIQ